MLVRVCVYLEIRCEGVREPHVAWKGTEDEVAELDAVGWDNITEAVMVVTEELWEVMQQNQKHSQCALKQPITKQNDRGSKEMSFRFYNENI